MHKAAYGCRWSFTVPLLSLNPHDLSGGYQRGSLMLMHSTAADHSFNSPTWGNISLRGLRQNAKWLHLSASLASSSCSSWSSIPPYTLVLWMSVCVCPSPLRVVQGGKVGKGGGGSSSPPDCEMQNPAVGRMCVLCNFHQHPLSPPSCRLSSHLGDVHVIELPTWTGCEWMHLWTLFAYGGCPADLSAFRNATVT